MSRQTRPDPPSSSHVSSFSPQKGDSDGDDMDLADYLERCLLDCWNCASETHSLTSNESSCCGQPRCSHCTLGIDGVAALTRYDEL